MLSSEYRQRIAELLRRKSRDKKYIDALLLPIEDSNGYPARPPSSMTILVKVDAKRLRQYMPSALEFEATRESYLQRYVVGDAISGERAVIYITRKLDCKTDYYSPTDPLIVFYRPLSIFT